MPMRKPDGSRDYKREYKTFHGLRKQKDRRNMRNKARRKMGMEPGNGKEVDHKVPLYRGGGNGKKNLRVVSRETNRSRKRA